MARRAVPSAVLIALGAIALVVAGDSTALKAAAIVLIGAACVWLVSLAFYEIGAAEDRDRAEGWRGPYDR